MRRRISIFGATGSIGRNTVSLVEDQGGAESYEVVTETAEVVITSSDGIVIRQEVKKINRYGRNSMGVKVMNLDEDTFLTAVSVAVSLNGDDDEGTDSDPETSE